LITGFDPREAEAVAEGENRTHSQQQGGDDLAGGNVGQGRERAQAAQRHLAPEAAQTLGQRPGGRRRGRGQRAGHRQQPDEGHGRPQPQMSAVQLRLGGGGAGQPQHHHHQRADTRREAQGLHPDVGQDRARGAQRIGRLRRAGGVQAGVGGVVGGEGDRQDDAEGRGQAAAQPRGVGVRPGEPCDVQDEIHARLPRRPRHAMPLRPKFASCLRARRLRAHLL